MSEYISLTKNNNNNETVFCPAVIAAGWGGRVSAGSRDLIINGNVNFKVLRTAFNRAGDLGIESETINGKESVLLFAAVNGVGRGIAVKLRDYFLDGIIGYIKTLYLENKTRQQISAALNGCCAAASKLCGNGDMETSAGGSDEESGFINSLAHICLSFGYEAVSVDISAFCEE